MPGIDKKLMAELEEYIRIYYVPEQEVIKESTGYGKYLPKDGGAPKPKEFDFDELISELGETFHDMLFRIIREQNRDETEVYKKAHVDRRLFSKIRNFFIENGIYDVQTINLALYEHDLPVLGS